MLDIIIISQLYLYFDSYTNITLSFYKKKQNVKSNCQTLAQEEKARWRPHYFDSQLIINFMGVDRIYFIYK